MKSKSRGLHILYISYWGIREPLGQALMIPPLLRFAEAGLRITLVSFEKPHHLADLDGMEESRQQMREAGIEWLPLRYHKTPTAPATAFDIAHGAARGILATLRDRPDVIHGRTYLGGLMAQMVSQVLRRPFIYHNEGFWPNEQVDGGNWAAGSRPYRITKRWERNLYRRAAAVITLAEPAREIVAKLRRQAADTTVVVPSCVDLERFQPTSQPADSTNSPTRMIYIGSLGFRYRGAEMARFVKAAQCEMGEAMLSIYSHSDEAMIREAMRAEGLKDEQWKLDFVPHTAMPGVMQQQDVGLFFLTQGVSTRVCSPTKIGEYWACGLPVVTTPHVGDVDAIVRREKVGVIVESDSEADCRTAAAQLRELLQDPDLSQRCRRAAEKHYSLEQGVATQLELYRRLARRK